jgi:hypothetical protein
LERKPSLDGGGQQMACTREKTADGKPARRLDTPISGVARLTGSSLSGILEIAIFHPFDTAGKRLMSYQSPLFARGRTYKESMTLANEVC